MPVRYSGIVKEHQAVRESAGIFDVSHMGQVFFRGPNAVDAVDALVTNDVRRLRDGDALYTPICQHDGGIVDDCIVYRLANDNILIIVNASNIQKDVDWFREHTANCAIENQSDEWSLLALQGPKAVALLQQVAGDHVAQIAPFTVEASNVGSLPFIAARTGYTGEDGFEILVKNEHARHLWDMLHDAGANAGLVPCGLGARDTLRLEARLPLYGNDIDHQTTPLEAGLNWTVKFTANPFIGKEALRRQKEAGISRKLVGLEITSRGIARQGHPIFQREKDLDTPIGAITSGTKSPTLGKAIALGYVPIHLAKRHTQLTIDVRGKKVDAHVVKGAFYKRRGA